MTDSIYKQNALLYLQKGFSVIPDKQGSKIPAISGWNNYSTKMPSIDEVNTWALIPDTNISVLLGPQSGIVALDLDTDSPEIMNLIGHLLPPSPVEKKGSKGYTRFFRYNGEESTEVFEHYTEDGTTKKRVILELLSTGKKTTIPPSVHPKGHEYTWTTLPLLGVDKSILPILPSNLMATIASKLKMQTTSYTDNYKISSGRNSALGAYCAELIKQQLDVESAVAKLIDFDKKNNTESLFSDSNEFKTKYPVINAGRFYFNYLESINIKREKQGLLPELPVHILTAFSNEASTKVTEKETFELPKATGTLKLIIDYILERSYVEQPLFALSAACTLLGTLMSRKMVFQNVTPNLYMLNVAGSGSGKDSCQQSVKTLLKAADAPHLIGASTYPSEASIIAFLQQAPVRLDVIDEASSFLKSASSGGAPYQTGIGDTLCELYTSANEQYLGKVLASNGGQKVGACWRPHVNILCSTTFRGVSEGISQSTLEKGLFARFITLFGEEDKPAKRVRHQVPVPPELADILKYWSRWQNPKMTGNMPDNFPPYELSVDKDADELIDIYFYKLDDLKRTNGNMEIMKPVVARLFQQMLKIVLISSLSNTKIGHIPKVTKVDVQFGYDFIRYFYANIREFIENTLHDSERAKNVNKVLFLIKKAGVEGLTNIDLVKQSKSIRPQERLEIIKDLFESQLITRKEVIKDNNVIHVFNYIGD